MSQLGHSIRPELTKKTKSLRDEAASLRSRAVHLREKAERIERNTDGLDLFIGHPERVPALGERLIVAALPTSPSDASTKDVFKVAAQRLFGSYQNHIFLRGAGRTYIFATASAFAVLCASSLAAYAFVPGPSLAKDIEIWSSGLSGLGMLKQMGERAFFYDGLKRKFLRANAHAIRQNFERSIREIFSSNRAIEDRLITNKKFQMTLATCLEEKTDFATALISSITIPTDETLNGIKPIFFDDTRPVLAACPIRDLKSLLTTRPQSTQAPAIKA